MGDDEEKGDGSPLPVDLTIIRDDGRLKVKGVTGYDNLRQHAAKYMGAEAAQVARDAGGAPTLCWAAAGGKADIVSLLIDHGAEINARDADGATAGDIAKERNILEIVELLRQTAANQE